MEVVVKKCLSKEEMLTLLKSKNVKLVRVECEDMHCVSRGFTLDVDFFLRQFDHGIPIPKGIYAFKVNKSDMVSDTGVLEEIGYGNAAMYPDFRTFTMLPWEPGVASILSEVRIVTGNSRSPLLLMSPRAICKLQLAKLETMGFQLYGSFEFEFYLLNEKTFLPVNEDENAFSTYSQTKHLPFIKDVIDAMKGIGIRPELYHTECGPAQQEITISPEFGIQSADNAFRFRNLVKEIAAKHQYMATFLSKPFSNGAGSSGHHNHSLWDKNGRSCMFDENRPYGLSQIAENWLAGLRYHTNALTCLASILCNCYERIEGLMAPINNSWSLDNRTVTYRVKKNHRSANLYIENRMPGAAVNPYLLIAGCIIAGMDGIKRKMKLNVRPFETDISKVIDLPDGITPLPSTLSAALKCLLEDEIFVQELGPEFIKCFAATRKSEIISVSEARCEPDEMFEWYRNNYAEFV